MGWCRLLKLGVMRLCQSSNRGKSMRTTWLPGFRVCASFLLLLAPKARGQDSLRFTYLGAAGWEITYRNTVVIVDPYFSRLKDNTPNDRPAPEDTRPKIVSAPRRT